MYIKEWDDFYQAAEALFNESPTQTRCVTKYRHVDGVLVMKVTDNKKVRKNNSQTQFLSII